MRQTNIADADNFKIHSLTKTMTAGILTAQEDGLISGIKTAARHNRHTKNVGAPAPSRYGINAARRRFARHSVDWQFGDALPIASVSFRGDENGRTGAWRKHKARLPDVYKWRKAKLCGAVRPRR